MIRVARRSPPHLQTIKPPNYPRDWLRFARRAVCVRRVLRSSWGFVAAFGFELAPFCRKAAKARQLTVRWLPTGLDSKGREDIVSIILTEVEFRG
jgi:hypothetical protein